MRKEKVLALGCLLLSIGLILNMLNIGSHIVAALLIVLGLSIELVYAAMYRKKIDTLYQLFHK